MPPPGHAVLVDTGLLVALFNRLDSHHATATAWMAQNHAPLLTVEPVLSETAYFLPAHLRAALARLAARGVLRVHTPDETGLARMAELFDKYQDQDPDWADVALIWLAEATGCNRIATLDIADFSVYRINGRKRFEMALLG
jgi:predicted nucleic acid-binding protein